MKVSSQEYWSGLPFLSLGDLPNLGTEPGSPALQADSLQTDPSGKQSPRRVMSKNVLTIDWTVALISHASKVMLKILIARPQHYANQELRDVQAGFRKGRGTRDQIANIHRSLTFLPNGI